MRYYEIINLKESQIQEIYVQHEQDPGITFSNYQDYSKYDFIKETDNFKFYIEDHGDIIYFIVEDVDTSTTVSVLCIQHEDHLYKIFGSKTEIGFQSKGLMSSNIELAVEKYGCILSDSSQSSSAMNMWKKLLSNTRYNPVVYDTENNTFIKYDPKYDDDIWDDGRYLVGIKK